MTEITKVENCLWCNEPYVKERTIAYCSDSCRQLMTKKRWNDRRLRDYSYIEVTKVGRDYDEYPDNTQELLDKYSSQIPVDHETPRGTVYKVPHYDFKQYHEPKNIILLTARREAQRVNWNE